MKININGVTRDMTAEEETEILVNMEGADREIEALKQKLSDTDYMAIKYAEGWLTSEEYAAIKTQRQGWRERINELGG
jgi:hypothetical protein